MNSLSSNSTLTYFIVFLLLVILVVVLYIFFAQRKRHSWWSFGPVVTPSHIVGGCAGTRYGCCPDGKTSRINAQGSNC